MGATVTENRATTADPARPAAVPAGDIALDRLRPLPLHQGILADDFCSYAAELRQELLRFPRWKPFRLGGGSNYSFQTGITTGHIQGRFDELARCHRFEAALLACGEELCRRVGAAVGGELAIDISGMAYGKDGRLKRHTDSIGARRLAWILYLTDPDDGEWPARDGGPLVLSDGPGADAGEVVDAPRFNRFVAFQVTDASWHEIRPVLRDTPWPAARLCLAGWLHE